MSRRIDWSNPKGAWSWRFDDVGIYLYTHIFPLFKRYNVTGTIALNPDSMGQSGMCNYAQMREMEAAGWEIAFHGGHDGTAGWIIANFSGGWTALKTRILTQLVDMRTNMGWAADYVPPLCVAPGHRLDHQCVHALKEVGFKWMSDPLGTDGGNVYGWGPQCYQGNFAVGSQPYANAYSAGQAFEYGRYMIEPIEFPPAGYTDLLDYVKATIALKGMNSYLNHPISGDAWWNSTQNIAATMVKLEAAINLLDKYDVPQVHLGDMCEYMMHPANTEQNLLELDLTPNAKLKNEFVASDGSLYGSGFSGFQTFHPNTDAGGPPSGNAWVEAVNTTYVNITPVRWLIGGYWTKVELWTKDGTNGNHLKSFFRLNKVGTTAWFNITSPATNWKLVRRYFWVPASYSNRPLEMQLYGTTTGTCHIADLTIKQVKSPGTNPRNPNYDWTTDTLPPVG